MYDISLTPPESVKTVTVPLFHRKEVHDHREPNVSVFYAKLFEAQMIVFTGA